MKNKFENILMDLSKNFDSIDNEQYVLNEDGFSVKINVSKNENRISINMEKVETPSLQSFLERIDENTWSYILDNFQEVTGQSLKAINSLYEKKDYNTVKELIKLVLTDYIDKLENLLDD